MEAWVHGNAVGFDPELSRESIKQNDLSVGPTGARVQLNPQQAERLWIWFNFPWPWPGTVGDERPLTIDEVLVRARSIAAAEVKLSKVHVSHREGSLLSTRLGDPVKPEAEFAVLRFPGERPQGWTDYDTPIVGPLSVGLEMWRSGVDGGAVDISAVGLRLRLAYVRS